MVSTQPPRLLTFWWQWERIWMWICLLLSFHTSYHYTLCDHFILHIISYYVIISYHPGCWPFGDNGWESGWEFAFCRHFILHIFICDISYFITFHTMWSFPTRLSTFWWQWVRMWTEKVKMGARLSDVLFRLVFIIIIINYHQYCYYHHQYNFSKEGHTCVVKILLDKGASLTDKVIELSKNVGNDIHLSWFFYWPSFFYLSVLIDWLIELASLTRCHS